VTSEYTGHTHMFIKDVAYVHKEPIFIQPIRAI